MEETRKKEKELMDVGNSVVIAEREGWVELEEGIRGINGKRKNKKINY